MLQCHRNPQAENGPEAGQVAIEDGMVGGFHPPSRHQRTTHASGEEQLKKTRNERLLQPCFQRHPSCLPKNERATKFDWEMVCQMPRIPSLFGIGFSDCILVSNAWNKDRCPKKLCSSTWHDRPVLAGWPGWEGSWKQCKVPRKPWMPRNEEMNARQFARQQSEDGNVEDLKPRIAARGAHAPKSQQAGRWMYHVTVATWNISPGWPVPCHPCMMYLATFTAKIHIIQSFKCHACVL